MRTPLRLLALAALALPFAGCDSAGGPADGAGRTTLTMQALGADRLAAGPAAGTAARGGAPVTLTEVKLLLNSIHLNGGSGDDGAPEQEVELEDANVVVDLDLGGSATPVAIGEVPAGSYSRVTFQIHKPEDAEAIPDPEFRDGPSGNQRYSVILRGTVDGEPFTLKVRDGMQQRLTLSPALVVGDGGTADLTLQTDVSTWFTDADGNALDPRDSRDADRIADRIDASFRARR